MRNALAEDCQRINLTTADMAESVAATGYPLPRSLSFYHSQSDETWAAEADGELISLGGLVADDSPGSADVWGFFTESAEQSPLASALKPRLAQWREDYGLLYGHVDDRNSHRKRWLQRLGFRVTSTVEPSPNLGLPFRIFVG